MSVTDSIYTSPDALRAKYRNPRNPLSALEEATSGNDVSIVETNVAASVSLQAGYSIRDDINNSNGSGNPRGGAGIEPQTGNQS